MNLNETNWSSLQIGDKVISNVDQVQGTIVALDSDMTTNTISIVWASGITMRFNHNWATEITYIGE